MSKLLWSPLEANELSWQNFKHICTDRSRAMIGVKPGFVILVKNEWPYVTSSHGSLHQYTLASKTLPLYLMEGMDVAVSDQLHSGEGKKSSALPTFGQRNWNATCGTFVSYQSPLAVER